VAEAELARMIMGGPTTSGLEVDRITAMGVSAVQACVRLLSETVASLPVVLYKRIEKGKERAEKHPVYDLMHRRPNDEQSAFYFKETMMHHVVLLGNAYAKKEEGGGGQIKNLWPQDPQQWTVERRDNRKVFVTTDKKTVLSADKMLHIPGIGYDGLKGYDMLNRIRDIIGQAMAVERYGAEFFKNYGGPGGYLEITGRLKDENAVKRLKASWGKAHTDWGNRESIGVLEDGTKFVPISVNPNQSQFIETRQFITTEIARVFRVPPHLIADLSRSTFSNIEHQGIEFVVYTMRPWLVRWEQELSRQLLSERDQQEYFFEFLVDALLRGDIASRMQAYRTGIEMGVYTDNEVREMENKNPYEGGDAHYVPMNWVPTELAGQVGLPAPASEPEPEEEPEEEPEAKSLREQRSLRSANMRHKTAKSYEQLFKSAADRIIRKERRDLKEGVKKYLSSRGIADFDLYLDKYYYDLPEYIRKQITPTYRTFAEEIKREIAEEVGGSDKLQPEDEAFLASYITNFAYRYIAKSRADIKKAITRGVDSNLDLEQEVEDTFDHWEQTRGAQIALNESVRSSNAIAKAAYVLAGVTVLRWMALGPDACPFCQSLNGAIVSTQNFFVMPDDQIVPDNNEEMQVQRKIGHPPLHNGCVCQIVAG